MDTKPPEYIPATQLRDELDIRLRTLRQWLHRNHSEALRQIPHIDGTIRLMVRADAAQAARKWYRGDTEEPPEATSGVQVRDRVTSVDTRVQSSPDTTESTVASLAERAGRAEAQVASLTTERDTLRSERDTARALLEAAERRAAEEERGHSSSLARIAALRAAWWRWRVLLDSLGPVARLRRRWPAEPAELTADRLLEPPKG